MALIKFLFFGLLISNVLLRVFTNHWNILPRILNISDVFIVVALVGLSFFVKQGSRRTVKTSRFLITLMMFNFIAVVGTLLNFKYIYPMSALSQLVMWNEPILLFLAVINLPFTTEDVRKYKRLLLYLVGFEVAIGLIQVPIYLRTGASESITGTFIGNAEQYQFFVLIGVFYLVAQVAVAREGKRRLWTLLVVISIMLLLIDNKASWVALAFTLWYLLPRVLISSNRMAHRIRVVLMLGVLLIIGFTIVKTSSGSLKKFGAVYEAWETGHFLNIGKIKAFSDVARACTENEEMIFFGAGLGTFYSRAAFQFFPWDPKLLYGERAENAEQTPNDSASMAGVIDPVSEIEPFFRRFYNERKIFAIGSGTADFPASSYVSLMGETGLFGTILYLSFYVFIIRILNGCRERLIGDSIMYPFLIATLGSGIYLMLMAGYNFWLDCGRVNTIQWSMVAMVLKYVHLKGQRVYG